MLKADVSEHFIGSIFIGRSMKYFIALPMKMEPTESSETSAFSTQTPGKFPKENALHIKHSESLKSSKAISLQPWTGLEVSRKVRLPDFKTIVT